MMISSLQQLYTPILNLLGIAEEHSNWNLITNFDTTKIRIKRKIKEEIRSKTQQSGNKEISSEDSREEAQEKPDYFSRLYVKSPMGQGSSEIAEEIAIVEKIL